MSDTITAYVTQCAGQLEQYAPADVKIADWLRTVQLYIAESTEIQRALQTDQGKRSVFHALKFAAATGLSMNPQQGKCALIAYKNQVQFQIMKSGWIDLAMNSGKVDYLGSDIVRENDDFSVLKTMDGDRFEHRLATTNRGPIIGAYAAMKDRDGQGHVVYMSLEELEQHRDAYAASQKGPWSNAFPGMAIKTVIKKLLRNTHLSDRLTAAVRVDDKSEAGDTTNQTKGTGSEALGAILATAEVIDEDNQTETGESADFELLYQQNGPKETDRGGGEV